MSVKFDAHKITEAQRKLKLGIATGSLVEAELMEKIARWTKEWDEKMKRRSSGECVSTEGGT